MIEFQATTTFRPWVAAAACLLLVIAVGGSAGRILRSHQTPGPFDPTHQGFCDFQNGVYFPSLAFSQGVSPYSQEYSRAYPVERSIPFFSPVIVALHVPFAWLPLPTAEFLYFAWMLGLVATISILVTHWIYPAQRRWDIAAIVALALVATRSGQQTIFTGYFTFELVLASLLAVHYGKTRPWLSALALIVVSAKPNYVLPIALLMLCRGNLKAVVWGGILSAGLAAAAFAWILPETGLTGLLDQIRETQDIHRNDPMERPINTWVRVDMLAIYSKWTGWDPAEAMYLAVMAGFLIPSGLLLAVYHRSHDCAGAVTGLSGGIILLTALVAVYHHVYDCLTLVAVVAAVATVGHTDWKHFGPVMRWLLVLCMLFPGLNYLSAQKFLNAMAIDGTWHKLITSANAVLLLIAWLALLYLLARRVRSQSGSSVDAL